MQLLKKLIILSGYLRTGKGIIKIESFDNKSTAQIRIFEPHNPSYRLGIRIGLGRLLEYIIESETQTIDIEFTSLEERIDCVIVDNNTLEPLLLGSTEGSNFDITRILEMFTRDNESEELEDKPIIEETGNISEQDINSDSPQKDESARDIEPVDEDRIKEKISDSDKEKVQEYKDQLEQDFFVEIKPQLDELFKCYPADKELMLSVPDSKWIRVNYEKDEYYVVGVLYNGKRATHICYGVPGRYSVRPKQKSEWLPLDYMDPEGKGYWVIFQDAITGKTLE